MNKEKTLYRGRLDLGWGERIIIGWKGAQFQFELPKPFTKKDEQVSLKFETFRNGKGGWTIGIIERPWWPRWLHLTVRRTIPVCLFCYCDCEDESDTGGRRQRAYCVLLYAFFYCCFPCIAPSIAVKLGGIFYCWDCCGSGFPLLTPLNRVWELHVVSGWVGSGD